MHFLGPCVTVFGSARFDAENPYYKKAEEIGAEMAKLGFTIMTGGGPGIMEAANKGAYEAGGYSVGCNILLPFDQKPNRSLGTLDELFESLTLIQTKMIQNFPLVSFGSEYHKELCHHIQVMAENESISPEDMKLLFVTDSVPDLVEHIRLYAIKRFHLVRKPVTPSWWLGERKREGSTHTLPAE